MVDRSWSFPAMTVSTPRVYIYLVRNRYVVGTNKLRIGAEQNQISFDSIRVTLVVVMATHQVIGQLDVQSLSSIVLDISSVVIEEIKYRVKSERRRMNKRIDWKEHIKNVHVSIQ